jgi:hypothetical protein
VIFAMPHGGSSISSTCERSLDAVGATEHKMGRLMNRTEADCQAHSTERLASADGQQSRDLAGNPLTQPGPGTRDTRSAAPTAAEGAGAEERRSRT